MRGVISILLLLIISAYCSESFFRTLGKLSRSSPRQRRVSRNRQNVRAGVSQSDINLIVDLHNQLRNKVASGAAGLPKATNMAAVVWDANIAAKAQAWANRGNFEHSPQGTSVVSPYGQLGENIYTDSYPQVDWNRVIMSWYNEVNQFGGSSVSSYQFNSGTGHFTQIVWAKTTAIGCGIARGGMGNFMVCNYGPAGNFMGAPIYATSGTGCAQKDTKYTSLCAAGSVPADNGGGNGGNDGNDGGNDGGYDNGGDDWGNDGDDWGNDGDYDGYDNGDYDDYGDYDNYGDYDDYDNYGDYDDYDNYGNYDDYDNGGYDDYDYYRKSNKKVSPIRQSLARRTVYRRINRKN